MIKQQKWIHPLGGSLIISYDEEYPKMQKRSRAPKNNPSKVVNEVKVSEEIKKDMNTQAYSPTLTPELKPAPISDKWFSVLCLFFATGRTFTFREVFIQTDNENEIRFNYEAMSDGRRKNATFSKFHVVGISRTR